MTPIDGHSLRRASADCFLCQCGFAIFGAVTERDAGLRHSQHIDEIRKARARIKDAQKNKQQADFADAQEPHWGSPFRRGVLGR